MDADLRELAEILAKSPKRKQSHGDILLPSVGANEDGCRR